jgi:hypothetical protein
MTLRNERRIVSIVPKPQCFAMAATLRRVGAFIAASCVPAGLIWQTTIWPSWRQIWTSAWIASDRSLLVEGPIQGEPTRSRAVFGTGTSVMPQDRDEPLGVLAAGSAVLEVGCKLRKVCLGIDSRVRLLSPNRQP